MSSLQNLIRESDRGTLLEDADIAIDSIVEALEGNHERKGEVTIKLKFASLNGALQVTAELDHKLTKPKRVPSTIYIGADGSLSRRDPRQPVMPAVVDADELNRRRGGGTNQEG